jgi:hypothetical protein
MLGASEKARDCAPPKSLLRPARKPTKPPSEMCGNQSALATPMRALAAASSRSATRMSGRRASTSPALPIGSAVSIG